MMSDYDSSSKETFYSNLNGTTELEISLVLSVTPASVLLRTSLQLALVAVDITGGLVLQFLLDCLILVLPLFLSVTLFSDAALPILLTEVIMSVSLLFFTVQFRSFQHKPTSVQTMMRTPMTGRLAFITNFRVLNNIGVAIGILAVDFVIFPRRFAKTETFGTGIMDGGVGTFVFMNALVSPEARGKYDGSSMKSVFKSLKSSIPLLVLGLGRLASVKGIEYHEHITEYGVHWNFFFTLAATKILGTLLLCFIPVGWSGAISLSLALFYHHLLTDHSLQDLVLHGGDGLDTRDGFLNANREGLASCLGYLAIYFAGVRIGQYLLQSRSTVKQWLKSFVFLCFTDVILWLILVAVEQHIGPVSRRLANLPYIIWNVAYCIHILCSFLLIDIVMTIINHIFLPHLHKQEQSQKLSLLVAAIGRNQLLYFLLANVMTGLVNISVDTIHQPTGTAFFIIATYLLVLNIVMVFLHKKEINTKFW